MNKQDLTNEELFKKHYSNLTWDEILLQMGQSGVVNQGPPPPAPTKKTNWVVWGSVIGVIVVIAGVIIYVRMKRKGKTSA